MFIGRTLRLAAAGLASLLILFFASTWLTTYHPAAVQSEPVFNKSPAPLLTPGQKLKVLSWNIQFMAGKNHVFFFDLPNYAGPDERPSPDDISKTIKAVARVIKKENPDLILLQEVDDGAKRTDYRDQLAELLSLLPQAYTSHASAFYWKAFYVPHPRIMGSVGMKLSIISKYRISKAFRHQLALKPENIISQQFDTKRAVLEAHLPVEKSKDLVVMDTHLESFGQGTNVMEKQIKQIENLLEKLSKAGLPWIIGGDFNLLPPGRAYAALASEQKIYFKSTTEILPLFAKYQAVPGLKEVNSRDHERWFTHFPNDPKVKKPDRTIDYIFLSNKILTGKHYVRQFDALNISDHFPVITELRLP